MTILSSIKEMKEIINKHSIYGVESLMNALVIACKDHPYVNREMLHKLLDTAIDRVEEDADVKSKHSGPNRC